ncbi:MAG: sigma-54 dependent transcriptional regulator [Holosporales bacterium]|jgi:two-component system nitrogen regulation response regulator NtrX|nr:sigma-54 dependent transcriptional regulator [Holosporales bacterium]
MQSSILIIDDELEVRRLIAEILEDEKYSTLRAGEATEALHLAEKHEPTMVFLDLWLNDDASGGMAVLERLHEQFPDLPIVMISGHGTIEVALEAIRKGAYDFIEKPFVTERLLSVTRRACETAHLKKENNRLRRKANLEMRLIGHSRALGEVQRLIERVAPTNSRVFIHSPIGGEGEIVAHLVHEKSIRSKTPFIAVNCSMINAERLGKDLFGEEDANVSRAGFFQKAAGGTLFLEDITDMPADIQAKLLHVLQEGVFTRMGGVRSIPADVRIVSSTSIPRKELCFKEGAFRQDLYYRLSVVPIEVPPLAERREDILPLINHFLIHAEACFGLPPRKMSAELLSVLQAYYWPGNVRQVRNVIEWILIMASESEEEEIGLDLLPPEISRSAEIALPTAQAAKLITLPLKDARSLFERDYLIAQVERFSGNISQTAEFIGMERSALHRKLKSLQVPVTRHEDRGPSME